jgi:hypothetical protein
VTGPAPGCEAAPTATRAIASVSPSVINLGNAASGVTVSGVSDSADVEVTLSDGLESVTQTVSVTGGTWTAQFDTAQLQALEGTITASAMTTAGAAVNTGTLIKDLVAPNAPTVSPNGGAITGQRSVFIAGAAGDTLRYTVGNGSQAAPTATTGTVFTGPFNVSAGQTVKAVAVDAAGNASNVTTSAFTQAVPPPVVTPPVVTPPPSGGSAAVIPLAPGIAKAKSGKRGGNDTATAKWRAPVANGAVLSGYEVRALKLRPGRSAKIRPSVAVGSAVNKLRMSLPAGKYKFRVRAVSAAGKSPWSERSATVRSR